MKSLLLIFIIFSLNEVNGAATRKAPAFANSKYADSFIPAAMQVIFNGVEQFKSRRMCDCAPGTLEVAPSTTKEPSVTEEAPTTSTPIPTTISHEPGQHQPICHSCGQLTPDASSSTEKPSTPEETVASTLTPTTISHELGPHQPICILCAHTSSADASSSTEKSSSSQEAAAASASIPTTISYEPENHQSMSTFSVPVIPADVSSTTEKSSSSQEATLASASIPTTILHEPEQYQPINPFSVPVISADVSSTTEKSSSSQEATLASASIPTTILHEPEQYQPINPFSVPVISADVSSTTEKSSSSQEAAAASALIPTISHEPEKHQPISPFSVPVISADVSSTTEKSSPSQEAATTLISNPAIIPHEHEQHSTMCILCAHAATADVTLTTEKSSLTEAPEVDNEKPLINTRPTPSSTSEKPELSAKTSVATYETPETNHETSDVSSNDKWETSTTSVKPPQCIICIHPPKHTPSPPSSSEEKRIPTIDSVVEEIYELMKMKNNIMNSFLGGKSSSSGSGEDVYGDYDTDNRFFMLGEKVSQVPRPSLTTYLKRAKLPSNCSTLTEMALIYDSLSKDARNQGFAQYTGYSDEVLKVLETSAEGGMGSQLKLLLEKIVERRELTRADAKSKVAETLKSLNEPGSQLSRDLSLILPLHFES